MRTNIEIVQDYLEYIHKSSPVVESHLSTFLAKGFVNEIEGGDEINLQKLAAHMSAWNMMADTYSITYHSIFEEEGFVAAYYTVEGVTKKGAVFPKTHIECGDKDYKVAFLSIFQLKNGKIVEQKSRSDNIRQSLGLKRQQHRVSPHFEAEPPKTNWEKAMLKRKMPTKNSNKWIVESFLKQCMEGPEQFALLKYASPNFVFEGGKTGQRPLDIIQLSQKLKKWNKVCRCENLKINASVSKGEEVMVHYTIMAVGEDDAFYPRTNNYIGFKECVLSGVSLFTVKNSKIISQCSRMDHSRDALGVPLQEDMPSRKIENLKLTKAQVKKHENRIKRHNRRRTHGQYQERAILSKPSSKVVETTIEDRLKTLFV